MVTAPVSRGTTESATRWADAAAGFTIPAFLPLTGLHRELFTWTGRDCGSGYQFILRTFWEKTLFLQEILSQWVCFVYFRSSIRSCTDIVNTLHNRTSPVVFTDQIILITHLVGRNGCVVIIMITVSSRHVTSPLLTSSLRHIESYWEVSV